MKIEDLMENKKVLMIPVYSSRSYETGIYDLATDGNMSKYLIKIIKSKAKEVTILYPSNSKNLEMVKNIAKKYVTFKINWLPFNYGKNANITRNIGYKFYDFINKLDELFNYDLIISEVNTLAKMMANVKNKKFLYWMGTHNIDCTFWNDSSNIAYNKSITSNVNTACLIPGQVELFGGKCFYDKYEYEPKYFDKNIIYFPFRLSDKAYNLDRLKEAVNKLLAEGIDNFVVLYSDPNESHLLDKENSDIYIKVPTNKFVYNAILKGKPIIPFFDDLSINAHSNIYEFYYYDCMVLNNVESFYSDLKNILQKPIYK